MLKIERILVATDFSEASDAALLYGRNFARAYEATLHVLHVVDDIATHVLAPTGPIPDVPIPEVGEMQMDLQGTAQRRLEELLSDDDRQNLHARAVVLASPTPARAILTYAADERINLIIVGTHGRSGLAQFFMGSVAQHVVRAAPCPVLTVRQPEREFALPDALEKVDHTL